MTKSVILFLAANPDGTSSVDLAAECAAVERELKMTPGRDDFELRSKWAVTFDDLMRELNELQPTILHFSGHGNTSGIVLHGSDGRAHSVAGDVLADMIESTGGSARVVVLNACFTDTQAESLAEVVGCAVGMTDTIADDAALAFSVAFYRALGNHCSAYRAFQQARVALAGYKLDKRATPQCITRADVDASALFLGSGPVEPAPPQRARERAPAQAAGASGGAGIQFNTTNNADNIEHTAIGELVIDDGARSRSARNPKRG